MFFVCKVLLPIPWIFPPGTDRPPRRSLPDCKESWTKSFVAVANCSVVCVVLNHTHTRFHPDGILCRISDGIAAMVSLLVYVHEASTRDNRQVLYGTRTPNTGLMKVQTPSHEATNRLITAYGFSAVNYTQASGTARCHRGLLDETVRSNLYNRIRKTRYSN